MDITADDSYYMKFDKYICEIEIYNFSKYKSCIPVCYRIKSIIDMITDEEIESILLDEHNHVCIIREDNYNFQITPHIKILKKDALCVYSGICEHSDKIVKPINLLNEKIDIFIINELKRAYSDRMIAIYEDFIEKEQYLLYPNGYSGIYKKYDFHYNYDGFIKEEYFHINGKIEGIKKVYDFKGNIEREENYVSGKLNGITKIYKDNVLVETRDYFNENYYYAEFYKDDKIVKNGYYFLDINISYVIKFINLCIP
jgi:antitoxin component YwqK of YwqJK toxin-antitoxin module